MIVWKILSKKKNVGRPKANPNYNPIKARNGLSSAVAKFYLHPSAEMDVDKEGHATMKSLELYFDWTITKIRKLLVSASVYRFYKYGVDMVEAVSDLYNKGYTLEMIKDTLCISTGTVSSLLPYKLGTYNADLLLMIMIILMCLLMLGGSIIKGKGKGWRSLNLLIIGIERLRI